MSIVMPLIMFVHDGLLPRLLINIAQRFTSHRIHQLLDLDLILLEIGDIEVVLNGDIVGGRPVEHGSGTGNELYPRLADIK
jgi:hypothetical protein